MTVRLVPLGELEDREVAAWRELSDRAVEPNPFFDPDFVLPAARGLGEWDDVAIVCTRKGTEWTGCLPVRRYRRWNHLPLPCVATWLNIYCLLGTPLVAPGHESDALTAIVAEMLGVDRVLFAGLGWVSADGALADAVGKALPSNAIAFDRFERATLVRRPDDDYLDGWVKSKDRREFRRRARKLAEELGGEQEVVDRTDDPEALEAFIELEASGWKGQEGTALASNPAHAEFMRETARAFAKRDAFELIFLEAAGTVAAARCSFVAGGTDFCFKVAYDERFGRFGPGRDLELRLIDRFHANESVELMDSCTDPNNEMFNRLWPDRRKLATTVLPASGPLGKVAVPALRTAIALRDRRRRQRDAAG